MHIEEMYVWKPLTADGRIRWLKYSFGPGTANAVAVLLANGSWLVVSPPDSAPATVYDALEGGVTALLAPNAFHNMGQVAWRERFPDALSYAPSGSHARLEKRTPDVPYLALDRLAPLIAPNRLVVPIGMKTPDTLVALPTEQGNIWYVGDQFSNNTRADQVWYLRLLSKLVGSGPGFRCNGKPEMVYVRDRNAWLNSLRMFLKDLPPALILPGHGDPLEKDADARARLAIDAMDPRLKNVGVH